ncbi:MAG TPA: hypothetical protein H9780_02350, partial [Candidatus Mediterraneibacter merdavium]|nr:hypothetical protein [Candidatus Mediterraneibacter merdavium]
MASARLSSRGIKAIQYLVEEYIPAGSILITVFSTAKPDVCEETSGGPKGSVPYHSIMISLIEI